MTTGKPVAQGEKTPGVEVELDLGELASLVARLREGAERDREDTFPHPTGETRVIETHISHVLLTGAFAYKFKKPVDFGFLDFSTAARRAHFCAEEIRLNGRTAPEIYVDVARVTGSRKAPRIDGTGPVLAHAVRMRRFDDAALLDRMLEKNALRDSHAQAMAEAVARMHEHADRNAVDSVYGTPESVWHPVERNFEVLDGLTSLNALKPRLAELRAGSGALHTRLEEFFVQRRSQGFVRECHGDLHLGNIAWIKEHAVPFDAIEFNPDLRWIDVMSDASFTTMDLEARDHRGLAAAFISHYLDQTQDYGGTPALRYYQAYRAMVRAKVTGLRLEQDGDGDRHTPEIIHYLDLAARYLDLAARYLGLDGPGHTRPELFITRGLSGCGKSTLAHQVTLLRGAVRIRSDRVRRSLSEGAHGYAADARQRVYETLARHARTALKSGLSVIVDATFLTRKQRAPFQALARELNLPWRILDIQAPTQVLKQRIAERLDRGDDPSEAYPELVDKQSRELEPLSSSERHHCWALDSSDPAAATDTLTGRLNSN
ncbi:MAG: AAA family ATPase [Gammaproteobacteria bacterium]